MTGRATCVQVSWRRVVHEVRYRYHLGHPLPFNVATWIEQHGLESKFCFERNICGLRDPACTTQGSYIPHPDLLGSQNERSGQSNPKQTKAATLPSRDAKDHELLSLFLPRWAMEIVFSGPFQMGAFWGGSRFLVSLQDTSIVLTGPPHFDTPKS